MIFKQFYLPELGHASYLVGSEQTGEALVLDVRRDVETYFREAQAQEMRIAYACDTHQHNDYVSGICELPRRGEVQLLAGARAALGYPVRTMNDGQRLEMGEVVFETLDTPGHTPEHIALLITDRSRSEEPALLLSGGALLVGDVARPDLLGGAEQTRQNARSLCATLKERILALPDHVEVYPTHVAGSLCGGNIGSRLSTTIGYERRANQMLRQLDDAEQFTADCLNLRDLPAVPPYWRRMRKLNQDGPPPLPIFGPPPALRPDLFERNMADGVQVVDCRSPEAFSAHIPGALNVGAGRAFPTWAGTIMPADTPYQLVVDDPAQLSDITWSLLRIGYDLPLGWLGTGMRGWRMAGKPLALLPQWSIQDLHRHQGKDVAVIDVRQPGEWAAGHIPGAHHITGAELPVRTDEIPSGKTVAVICGSGYRSSVMASLLMARGHRNVVNVLGGMHAWESAGLPTQR